MDWIADPDIWVGLATLTAREIVLGVDTVIFISILAGKLPVAQQAQARRVGLGLAMLLRIALLFSLGWIIRLTAPLFTVLSQEISGRDVMVISGGLFLLAKRTWEIHERLEGDEQHGATTVKASFAAVIVQILLLDLVFSLDSVITAVGMVDELPVMIAAVVIAVSIMMLRRGDQRRCQPPPDGQDAGAQLPPADQHVAAGGGVRPAYSQRLHLLRDGVFGLR